MIAAILDHDEIGPEFRDLMHARTEEIRSCSRRCSERRSIAATSFARRTAGIVVRWRRCGFPRRSATRSFCASHGRSGRGGCPSGRRRPRPDVRLRDAPRHRRPSGRDRSERARNRRCTADG
jgi:hypothetical protein